MRTAEYSIDNHGKNVKESIEATVSLAQGLDLSSKDLIHLRLLAEELIGLVKGIAGDFNADYLAVQEDKSFRLKLSLKADMTKEMREQFLEASSSGRNESAKGFMGQIRDMIATALLPDNTTSALSYLATAGMVGMDASMGYNAMVVNWSMQQYKTTLKNESKKEEWDELERSIIANIADDVKVSINGIDVEITVYKEF
ncbi:MAG: hypothetical protein IJ757_03160 [Clostridiales bacterium]|nr:hypothetical protein [Clostridiales bacterium]